MELPKWFNGKVYESGGLVTNPSTGETAELTAEELTLYDLIMGAQMFGNNDVLRKGLDWFKNANPEAYSVLF